MRIFIPLAGAMIAQGLRFPYAAERLKEAFAQAALRDFKLEAKKPTMSRVSLLTGLQRKDVKAITTRLADESEVSAPAEPGLIPKIIARWRGLKRYRLPDGQLKSLPRSATKRAASFEGLVAEISKDVHHRTILDELLRQGLIDYDHDQQIITMTAEAFLPRADDPARLDYFGANLGDHAEAAARNIASTKKPPFFERAAHYNGLSSTSVAKLDKLARREFDKALARINEQALTLQAKDLAAGEAAEKGVERFRAGAFVFHQNEQGNRS